MNNQIDSIFLDQGDQLKKSFHQKSYFMGGALIILNLILMSCMGFYWINPTVHQYLSGKPL